MGNSSPPIFFDPKNRRWPRFIRGLQALGLLVTLAFLGLMVSILVNPVLPGLGLTPITRFPQSHHLYPPTTRPILSRHELRYEHSKSRLKKVLQKKDSHVFSSSEKSHAHSDWELTGFFVNWDDTSLSSLKQNIGLLDRLIPEWLHLADAEGNLRVDDSERQKLAMDFIRSRRPKLPICPLVNNFDSMLMKWENVKLAKMLKDPHARQAAARNLLNYVRAEGFAGISIDFEDIEVANKHDLTLFMRELYSLFHPLGLEVSQSVPVNDDAFDYPALARCADYLILMAYDEHTQEDTEGPVASQPWFREQLQRRFNEIIPSKFVVALGNYGYDWKEREKGSGQEISFQEAVKTAQESSAQIQLDPEQLNPGYQYDDENGKTHKVWFLDAVTAFNQLQVLKEYSPRGIGLWRLGSEDPSIWGLLAQRRKLDALSAKSLEVMQYGYDLDYEGKGEILKVTATPQSGLRQVQYDANSALIVGERLKSYPSSYVITRWGGDNKKCIALTFDDGPDPDTTPLILDILRKANVKATFFVIGLNADLNSGILKRIAQEGHEIGVHTFTHPNIALISQNQLSLELNTTERLLESRLGIRSLLFRPPYAEDVEPETPEQVAPLVYTSRRGYYTIGMQIDPKDWQRPGVDVIVNSVVQGAVNGDGNIVLLHDGGGDREQTVEALPRIIEELKRRQFELAGVSKLLGLNRHDVMPPLDLKEKAQASMAEVGFLFLNWISVAINWLFLIGIALGCLRLFFVGAVALKGTIRSRCRQYNPEYQPFVSVLVPAYNEEKVIGHTVQALLKSDHPQLEILVIDDGSTDATFEIVQRDFSGDANVRVFSRKNAGKAEALNYGMRMARGEIVIALDADTIFRPDTISKLVRHFADPKVGAVAGNAKVGNRINLLTRWQALEYITSQNLDRRAFEALNCIIVVPGAVGAWRRDLVRAVGGFAPDTLAEDADLTLRILRQGNHIHYEERALAYTEAPDTVKGFVKQRFRWMYGTLQAAWKHREAMFKVRYGWLGMVALPNIVVFQIFFPLISPIMDLLTIGTFLNSLRQTGQHHLSFQSDALGQVLFYYAVFMLVDQLAAILAFSLESDEDWTLLIWLPLQRFFYRQLMYWVALRSALAAVRGTLVRWGKLERKATVSD